MRPSFRLPAAAACLLLALVATATAADPGIHALTGARIVVAPGQVIESGTLVVRDGIIEAVGADVEPPADARVWELEGLTLYPGLIESFHLQDWPTPEGDAPAPQGGHPNRLVQPERDMARHAFDEDEWKKLRAAGFTSAVVVPEPGLFRGTSVLVNLGDDLAGSLLRRGVAQNATLQTNNFQDGYPGSLMGSIALFRQTLLDARWYSDARAAYAKNPAQARPESSTALEALGDVARGRAPIVLEARDVDDLLRLARLADEFDLDATLVGHGDEYKRLDSVVASGRPLILPVDLPDAPKVGEEDDLSVGLDTLRHWDRAPENPKRLADAGVRFVFTSHGLPSPAKIHPMLARVIERGFDRDATLAALTTEPAKRLGLDGRIGTLERGKIANLVVTEGDLFVESPKIRALWVDGRRYELQDVKPPTVDPLGTWSLVIDAGAGGQMPVQVVLAGSVETLSGHVVGPAGPMPFTEAYVSDDTVHFAIDGSQIGMPGTISFVMKVDGESASGSGTAPEGDFTFQGERTERPDPEVVQ